LVINSIPMLSEVYKHLLSYLFYPQILIYA
jgi:hypothetical protein